MTNEDEVINGRVDRFDYGLLEIEAKRRGMTVEQVASERFAHQLEEEIEHVAQVFFGAHESPSKPLQ